MSSQTRRILIADGHDALRRGLRTLLETQPHLQVVAEASDGRMALEEAHRAMPDIAIIDFSLPELNGFEVTRTLKREMPAVEVLIYTRHACEDVVRDMLQAGARGYVLKSDTEHDLLAAIAALSVHQPYFSSAISEILVERIQRALPTTQTILSQRERQVVQLVAEGQSNKQVAYALAISTKTVESHRAATMQKLKLRSTADLVRYAVRNNIIEA